MQLGKARTTSGALSGLPLAETQSRKVTYGASLLSRLLAAFIYAPNTARASFACCTAELRRRGGPFVWESATPRGRFGDQWHHIAN
jgi:hypothetical protein